MKKVVSIVLIAVMGLLLLSSCRSTDGQAEDASTIIANYSIKNSDDSDDFIVEVQDLGGVYSDLYDADGLYIKFKSGKDNIYNSEGQSIDRDEIEVGATLEVTYDGRISKKSPKTIKAYKVTVMD